MTGPTSAARLSRCITSRSLGAGSSARFFQTSAAASSEAPLYPSVAQLIHEHGIPESEIPKITATGPKGRLLKGDVLSHIGAIPSDYPSTLSSQLQKLAHLDLSNIKPAAAPAPQKPSETAPAPAAAAEAKATPTPAIEEVLEAKLALPISLSRVLRVQQRVRAAIGTAIPLSTFVARATQIANDALPVTQRSPTRQEIADQLFDEIVGDVARGRRAAVYGGTSVSRGDYVPEIMSMAELNEAAAAEVEEVQTADIIDILSGRAPVNNGSRRGRGEAAPVMEEDEKTSIFSITVPKAETMRGQAFLERMQAVLESEPEKLVML